VNPFLDRRLCGQTPERKTDGVIADNEEASEHFCVHGWMRVRPLSALMKRRR